MMEMVSSVPRLHKNIGEATMRRNEGARCSKRVMDGMCLQMATTSSNFQIANNINNNNNRTKCDEQFECLRHPCSSSDIYDCSFKENEDNSSTKIEEHHPVISIIGPLFAPEDFEIMEPLGEGFFSKVFKVRHISTGDVLVLKESKPTGACRRATHADAAREAAMMRRLKHENVLGLRGICISRDSEGRWDANLIVSYCQGGSLASLVLDKQQHLSWHRRTRYARDIACAMDYIHSQRIIHRDLTSSNVLICPDVSEHEWGKAVVADFGLSCPFPKRGEKLAQVGTTYFMSPECLKEEYYDEKSDVFSFGIILCQMIARVDVDPDGGLPRTSKFGFDYMLFTPLCPLDTPIELLKLAFNSCVMDPTARPSFTEARWNLAEILASLPLTNPCTNKMDMSGKEARLGRSRSDAALKRPKMPLTTNATSSRKLSNTFNCHVRTTTLVEGEVMEENVVNRMEELARHAARDEPEFRHVNPFLDHERFRNQRKILPRRRSETKTEAKSTPQKTAANTPRRRCLSMPTSINESFNIEHYTSFSYDGACDESRDDVDFGDASPATGIPMAYRDFDRKFLKQMIRFPSRRHTMHPDSVTTTTTSASASKSSHDVSAISQEIYCEPEKRASVVVYNETPIRQKRRLGRVCTSRHGNHQECCIL